MFRRMYDQAMLNARDMMLQNSGLPGCSPLWSQGTPSSFFVLILVALADSPGRISGAFSESVTGYPRGSWLRTHRMLFQKVAYLLSHAGSFVGI